MKTKVLLFFAIPLAIVALIYGYTRASKERQADEEEDQPIASASRVRHGTNGETVIVLDLKTQQLLGLQTTTLITASSPPEMRAYGRVLDPAPLVAMVSNLASARAALTVSGREYERLKTLAQSSNTSAHALESAEAAMRQDQIALRAEEAQLVAAWGSALAKQPNLPAFVQSLADHNAVLIRLEVPTGEAPDRLPTGALIRLPDTGRSVPARFVGRAATTDPQVQGAGFLFAMTNAPVGLTPGLTVTGFLRLSAEPLQGVVVPGAAVVRSDERAWIYLQSNETNFTRREITLDHPVTNGWFVVRDAVPGDRVVTTAAQMLLSEERKARIHIED